MTRVWKDGSIYGIGRFEDRELVPVSLSEHGLLLVVGTDGELIGTLDLELSSEGVLFLTEKQLPPKREGTVRNLRDNNQAGHILAQGGDSITFDTAGRGIPSRKRGADPGVPAGSCEGGDPGSDMHFEPAACATLYAARFSPRSWPSFAMGEQVLKSVRRLRRASSPPCTEGLNFRPPASTCTTSPTK